MFTSETEIPITTIKTGKVLCNDELYPLPTPPNSNCTVTKLLTFLVSFASVCFEFVRSVLEQQTLNALLTVCKESVLF